MTEHRRAENEPIELDSALSLPGGKQYKIRKIASFAMLVSASTFTLSASHAFAVGPGDVTTLILCQGREPTIRGTSSSEVLFGTLGADVIYGDRGDDRIYGLGGDDYICGGPGSDTLHGGHGLDRIFGEYGNDQIYGGAGDDRLWGQNDDDSLKGGPGRDYLSGWEGNDSLDAVDGDDGSSDQVFGGNGDDVIDAGDYSATAAADSGHAGRGIDFCDIDSIDNIGGCNEFPPVP